MDQQQQQHHQHQWVRNQLHHEGSFISQSKTTTVLQRHQQVLQENRNHLLRTHALHTNSPLMAPLHLQGIPSMMSERIGQGPPQPPMSLLGASQIDASHFPLDLTNVTSRISNMNPFLPTSSSLDSSEMLASARQSFTMTSSSSSQQAMHAEQRQVFAQKTQALQQTTALQSGTATATATATAASFSASRTCQISASTSKGVTRSFSSSSGFPTSSSSIIATGSENNGSTDSAIQSSIGDSMASFVSPFRRAPWNFRNFNRPLWTDMQENHRMTWDSSNLTRSSSQFQFSASQQMIFQASSNQNGEWDVRAFKDQRMMLRQSYGASESESDSDDDDYDTPKSITYRQPAALPYQQRLAIANKPYTVSDEDDVSLVAPSETGTEGSSIRDSGVTIEELPVTPEHKKCYKVANELLTSERSYVRILHLIDQIFHFRVDQDNRVERMFPPETITQMFCNMKSLYKLHHDHLLPQLEKRLSRWDDNPRIGDIMKDFAPFLKMYSEYVQNFDTSMKLISTYKEKSVRFTNIINEVQANEACGNLPIEHHFIGPVQRVPRYKLLLEEYLRRLPDDSEDRPDTEKALEIVSKAADHANETMRRIETFKKLLEVQENVKGVVDLVSPTRTLAKEGKIFKISARTGEHQERYIFLFSDVILLCSTRIIANKMISPANYQLRAKLDVATVSVAEGDDLEVVNTFYVEDSVKKIELYTSTLKEKEDWMTAIHKAKEELIQRKSSLRLGSISPTEDDLGTKEPTKVKSDSVSKCMECFLPFKMFMRKHHCHACGKIFCAKCSDSKVPLQHAGGKACRVCKRCKLLLEERAQAKQEGSAAVTPEDGPEQLRGVLDVQACEPAILSGSLSLKSQRGRKEWSSRWFALRTDFVMYCYAAEKEERAMTATPLPGMTISMIEDLPKTDAPNVSSSEKERVFRLAHAHGRKSFVFLAPTRNEALKWVTHLKLAAKAELPPSPSNNNVPTSVNNQP